MANIGFYYGKSGRTSRPQIRSGVITPKSDGFVKKPLKAVPCPNASTWQFGLGMHNFRAAERETLRVRKRASSRLVVTHPPKGKVFAICEQFRRKDVVGHGRIRNRADASVPGTPLPLSSPARRSARRRLREPPKPMVSGRKALNEKNPVKVSDAKRKGLTLLQSSRSTRFWLHVALQRIVDKNSWVCGLVGDARIRENSWKPGQLSWVTRSSYRVNAAMEASGLICNRSFFRELGVTFSLSDYSTQFKPRPISYVRHGSNRKQKRRNWVTDRVVKKLPQWVSRTVSKAKLGLYKHRAMGPKGVLHSGYLVRQATKEKEFAQGNERTQLLFQTIVSRGVIDSRKNPSGGRPIRRAVAFTQPPGRPFETGLFWN